MSEIISNLPPIDVSENTEGQPFDSSAKAESAGSVVAPERRVRIILEESDEIPPTGQFIGLNGKGYILRAGEAAEVPVGLLEILDNAVKEIPVLDPNTLKVVAWRKRMRFPYRVVNSESQRTT